MVLSCSFFMLKSKYKSGSVAAVTAAMEAGILAAENAAGVVQHHIIPNPDEGTEKMLKINAFDKN